MTTSTPPPVPPAAPLPPVAPVPRGPAGNTAAPRRISVRKVILALVLAGSIFFCFLALFAGGVAILEEAAPRGGRGELGATLVSVKHAIARHLSHFVHHK